MDLWQRIKFYWKIFTLTQRIPYMATQADFDAIVAKINTLETLQATINNTDIPAANQAAANVQAVAAAGTAAVQAAQATADANNKGATDAAAPVAQTLATDQQNAAAQLADIKAAVAALS
jgi:hypothetical protein